LPYSFYTSSDLNEQVNGKQGILPGKTITNLNASIYKNIFRNNKGEIKLSAYNILNSSTGFSETKAANYIQTQNSTVLNRYIVLSLRYNLG
jgi:hypothetical protein